MAHNTAWQEALSKRFRRLLSGASDGTPPWLDAVARGEDAGFFLPTDAPWVVHRDFGTLVGGIRALLVQALHPGSLAGVRDHSRYEKDPLGRLAGTIRWLTVTTFAGREAVAEEARRVTRLHDRVNGEYSTGRGDREPYSAHDRDLLLWVHVAFMESFLVAHEMYSSTPIPRGAATNGADNYVAQWGAAVGPLGLETTPRTRAEVDRYLDESLELGDSGGHRRDSSSCGVHQESAIATDRPTRLSCAVPCRGRVVATRLSCDAATDGTSQWCRCPDDEGTPHSHALGDRSGKPNRGRRVSETSPDWRP